MADNTSPPDSPLAYARYYSLCSRYTALDHTLLPPWPTDLPTHDTADEFDIGQRIELVAQDNWHVDAEVTNYLYAATEDVCTTSSLCNEIEWWTLPGLQLELPALFHDHDEHMAKLLERIAHTISASEIKASCPPWQGDALGAVSDLAFGASRTPQQQSERFLVPGEVVTYIGELLSLRHIADLTDMLRRGLSETAWTKEDTPIMPLTSSVLPQCMTVGELLSDRLIPSPSAGDGLWTDELEQEVLAMFDNPPKPTGDIPFDVSMSEADLPLDLPGPGTYQSIQDLELTSPAIPVNHSTYANMTQPHSLELKQVLSMVSLPIYDPKAEKGADIGKEITDLLQNIAADDLVNINRSLASERLIEIDTTLKVPLPAVRDVVGAAPWQINRGRHVDLPIAACLHLLSKDDRRWKGVTKIERGLRWSPFNAAHAIVEFDRFLSNEIPFDREEYGSPSQSIIDCEEYAHSIPCRLDDEGDALFVEPQPGTIDIRSDRQITTPGVHQPTAAVVYPVQTQALTALIEPTVKHDGQSPNSTTMQALLRKRKLEIETSRTTMSPETAPTKRALPDRISKHETATSLLNSDLLAYLSAQGREHARIEPLATAQGGLSFAQPLTVVRETEDNNALPRRPSQQQLALCLPYLP